MLHQSVELQTGCGQYDVPCNTCAFISSTDHSVLKDHPEVSKHLLQQSLAALQLWLQ